MNLPRAIVPEPRSVRRGDLYNNSGGETMRRRNGLLLRSAYPFSNLVAPNKPSNSAASANGGPVTTPQQDCSPRPIPFRPPLKAISYAKTGAYAASALIRGSRVYRPLSGGGLGQDLLGYPKT